VRFQLDDVKWLNCTVADQRQGSYSGAPIKKRNCCVGSDNTEGEYWLRDWKESSLAKMLLKMMILPHLPFEKRNMILFRVI
jgi:hypothetical protein